MEKSIITEVFLPISLAIIMLGMGLSLVVADFKRVLIVPKATLLGLFCQVILLPMVGLGVALGFGLKGELAVGLILVALCPGGVTSNLISHLSKGDTALSITLTAFSSAITIFTIPIFLSMALDHFLVGQEVHLPILKTIAQILVITLIPVSIGMVIRAKAENFAKKMEKPVKIASAIILVVIIAGAILKNKAILADAFADVGLSTLTLNVVMMGIAFGIGVLFKLTRPQAITLSIESGVQNGTMAIIIAMTILDADTLKNDIIAIPAAIYSLLMFVTGGIMIGVFGFRKEAPAA